MGGITEKGKKFFFDTLIRWVQKILGEGFTRFLVVMGVWNYLLGIVKSFSLNPTYVLAWLEAHPHAVGLVVVTTAIFSHLLRLALSRRAERIKEHRALVAIGLTTYFDPGTDGETAHWDYCVEQLNHLNATELDILGVTGWNTFASEKAPLRKFVDSFTGHLKILLLAPESKGFESRVEDLASAQSGTVSEAERLNLTEALKREYEDTIKYCKGLAKKPKSRLRSIEVKIYQDRPIWKLLFANDHVWVQQYDTYHHVAETPSFVFRNNRSQKTSFQRAFWSVWLRRWDDKNSESVSLLE